MDTLAQRLGIRADLSPATFLENDARDLLRRIRDRFERFALDGALDERTLREVVRPAYRNLIELLAGPAGDDDEGDDGGLPAVLGDEPVLAQDGAGAYRFVPGRDCFYVARSGTLVRLGPRRLVTFILEASVTGRRALRQLGIRTLEDVLAWTPGPGPVVLEEDELNAFHTGLSELAPYVLARLRADRNDDRTARRDAQRLRALLGAITPVESLALQCQLDGESLLVSESRDAHVGDRADGSLEAYVRWDTTGWPPSSGAANALASLFVDAMGAGAFEAYLALITADSPLARQRLLTYAGAPTDLREFRDLLLGQVVPDEIPTLMQPGGDGRTAATERNRVARRPDALCLGQRRGPIRSDPAVPPGAARHRGRAGGRRRESSRPITRTATRRVAVRPAVKARGGSRPRQTSRNSTPSGCMSRSTSSAIAFAARVRWRRDLHARFPGGQRVCL